MTILLLTHRLPWAPNRGDRIRAYHLLRALVTRHEVHLLSLVHDEEEASHAGDLKGLASSVTPVRIRRIRARVRAAAALAGSRPLTFALLDAPGLERAAARVAGRTAPDVVVAYCSSMARLLRVPALAARPAIIDMVDVDSEKWAALGAATRGPLGWIYRREARLLGRAEADLMRAARATTVVNDREAAAARRLAPDADVRVASNGIDLRAFSPPAGTARRPQVVFCGVMRYAPNFEAARFLARNVWPIVRASRPDARLALVGADPPRELRRLAARCANVTVTGTVADVKPWLWESAVGAAPLATARGIQNKVLEALAAELPVVVSPAVAAGLPPAVLAGCQVAGDAAGCARAVLDLLDAPPGVRRARAARAQLAGLTWDAQLAPMIDLVESLSGERQERYFSSSA